MLTLFRDVNLFYVDEIEPEKLVQTGIDAMLKSLDPYTVYYPESKMDEFKMMTTGAYAGIGSVISMKDDYVVIREPYRNSPADRAWVITGRFDSFHRRDGYEGKEYGICQSALERTAGERGYDKDQTFGSRKAHGVKGGPGECSVTECSLLRYV